MNALIMITEVGQQRSLLTRLIIITAVRFLSCKNQIQLVTLESGDLGLQTGSFGPIQFTQM